jgi:hypothetical protein
MEVTLKHKCQGKVVSQRAKRKTHKCFSYNEHADMHYDSGGWNEWEEVYYEINECKVCGQYHEIKKKR